MYRIMRFGLGIFAGMLVFVLAGCSGDEGSGGISQMETAQPDRSGAVRQVAVDVGKSTIAWKGSAVGKSHMGMIGIKDGMIDIDEDRVTGMNIVIDMNAITNDDLDGAMRDKLIAHLKSDDFFAVTTYPEAYLTVSNVQPGEKEGAVVMVGDLTMKNITQPVSFDAHTEMRDGRVLIVGDILLDRTLWNVQYGSKKFFEQIGDKAISDMIELHVTVMGVQ